jgi:hypothetical protein
MENKHAKEARATLLSYGLGISDREVSYLAGKFLDHLEMAHFASSRPISTT